MTAHCRRCAGSPSSELGRRRQVMQRPGFRRVTTPDCISYVESPAGAPPLPMKTARCDSSPSTVLGAVIVALLTVAALPAARPIPLDPASPLMLAGDWVPENPHDIDFDALPRIPSRHAVVSDVMAAGGNRVNQHNYLVHHAGRFWAMWSDGPGESRGYGKVPGHDRAGQHVSFATSDNGLTWGAIGNLTGAPDEGYGWIARGFWVRDGKLLALASRYQAPGYDGAGLSLHAFEAEAGEVPRWRHLGLVFDDALNNFPPKLLPGGEWMMSRRDGNQNVHFLVGGTAGFDRWTSYRAAPYKLRAERPEEPYWWVLPDERSILALFRDNSGSGYLLRAFSTDNGRNWTEPVRTNFPDAKSKFSGVRLPDGRYVLVSNPHPQRRDPLALSVSDDGVIFDRMGLLVSGRHVDYPHVIEHAVHIDGSAVDGALVAEQLHPLHEVHDAVGLLTDEPRQHAVVLIEGLLEELGRPTDARQGVLDLVRQHRGETGHRARRAAADQLAIDLVRHGPLLEQQCDAPIRVRQR